MILRAALILLLQAAVHQASLDSKPFSLTDIISHTSVVSDSGTDSHVYLSIQIGTDEPSEYFELDDPDINDRERGSHDIYRGTSLDGFNQFLGEYPDFNPETAEITIRYKLTYYNSKGPAWNTDLLKLYFSSEEKGEVVEMRCLVGEHWLEPYWRTLILEDIIHQQGTLSILEDIRHLEQRHNETEEYLEELLGERNFEPEFEREFKCEKLEKNHPYKSIEMIEAHSCNIGFSGSDGTMRLKICKQQYQFQSFDINSGCCTTNAFSLYTTTNTYKKFDSYWIGESGAVLGDCEGFDVLGTEIYVAFENDSSDSGCFDELRFYGNPPASPDVPFASCHFNPVQFDSKEVRQYGSEDWSYWTEHMKMPIKCNFNK